MYFHCLTSSSEESSTTSLLRLDNVIFGAGFVVITLVSTFFATVLGSKLGAGFGGGAGLGCRFGNGLVSALLVGLLPSLDCTLFSKMDGDRSCTEGALSGTSGMEVPVSEGTLEEGRGASSSSGKMRLFLTGGAAAGVMSGVFASESSF